jgi:hypothetical protein
MKRFVPHLLTAVALTTLVLATACGPNKASPEAQEDHARCLSNCRQVSVDCVENECCSYDVGECVNASQDCMDGCNAKADDCRRKQCGE